MHIAFYKGPATDLAHKIGHLVTCLFTQSRYSHCELVIDGWCYSASSRDGGVRKKQIDLNSGKWDLLDINYSELYALEVFEYTNGLPYDWCGVLRYGLPFLPNKPNQWYCSEWCAYALGIPDFEKHPGQLHQYLLDYATIGNGIPAATWDE